MASSIAEALAGRSIVLTSLPDPKAVTEAWLGADGIVAHAAKGTLCIELSTIDPQTMRQVAEAAAARGIAVVDCPVSGSPNEARAGKLILIAGGEMADVTRAEPILKLLGNDWKYTGGGRNRQGRQDRQQHDVDGQRAGRGRSVRARRRRRRRAGKALRRAVGQRRPLASFHQALSERAQGRFLAGLQDGARRKGSRARASNSGA